MFSKREKNLQSSNVFKYVIISLENLLRGVFKTGTHLFVIVAVYLKIFFGLDKSYMFTIVWEAKVFTIL